MNAPRVSPKTKTLSLWSVPGVSYRRGSSDKGKQIVDSIMALFRTDFSGRGELSERQQKVRVLSLSNDDSPKIWPLARSNVVKAH